MQQHATMRHTTAMISVKTKLDRNIQIVVH